MINDKRQIIKPRCGAEADESDMFIIYHLSFFI
jgi:hypothetical protein